MKKGLSGNQLKLIAIAAMTFDHLVWTLWPGYDLRWWVLLLHIPGRITAPIMWYFIAEGHAHTRSVKKYALRLFILAVISHFAYNFCFGIPMLPLQDSFFNQTGVVWSLAWGLVLLEIYSSKRPAWFQLAATVVICLLTFPSDWSCVATLAVAFLGCRRGDFRGQMTWLMIWSAVYALVYAIFLDPVYGLMQLATCLSIPLLRLYNGTRGSAKWVGKLFYIFYPAHLALLGLLRVWLAVHQ